MSERYESRCGLPEASRQAWDSAVAAMSDDDYYRQAAARFEEEQPAIGPLLLHFFAIRAETPGEMDRMVEAGLVVYDLLSRQHGIDAADGGFHRPPQ